MVPLNVPVIRYAETEHDVTAIHQFLLEHAKAATRCEVDFRKSLFEVLRVCNDEVAIMCFLNGELVGTLGMMEVTWWYGPGAFLTDRWHFCKPEHYNGPVNTAIMDEARKIASEAGLEFIHQGKIRGEKGGVVRMTPRVYVPDRA